MNEPAYLTYFRALCAIPHGSGQTRDVSDFCVAFAKAHGLDCAQDEYNNVVIRKPASEGYEDHPTVVLQGHLDMVCEKDADCPIDMTQEPLCLCFDGDKLYAKGTTLGGDDGIAVAYALAILADDSIEHPALEVLLTTDEEIGMIGANALDPALITGRTLINMDSEEEGILLAGCAGGAHILLRMPITREHCAGKRYSLRVTGLPGGHSGTEINMGHANADYVLADALRLLAKHEGFALLSMEGGTKDNAIPRQACAVFLLQDDDAFVAETLAALEIDEKKLYPADKDLRFIWQSETDDEADALDDVSTGRFLDLLAQLPNGVQAMSAYDASLVQTSLNLGILKIDKDSVQITISVRSSINAERDALLRVIESCADAARATAQVGGLYPGWEFKQDSRLRDVMCHAFETCYGKLPKVQTIHAGLECGLFCNMWEDLDCISMGPNMYDIHTPRESLSLASAARTWHYLLEVLKNL